MDLIRLIDHWGHVSPDHLAHVSASRRLTYGELVRCSDSLAAYLADELPDDRSPVAILGHKEPEMLVAFLGAIKSGHPYVPIDSTTPAHRVQYIVKAAGANLVLTPSQVADVSPNTASRLPATARRLSLVDPCYIMFTSGSTGQPKGVVIPLCCLTSFVEWMLAEHSLEGQRETYLNQAPFSFDLSVMDLYLSLATGGTLFSLSKDDIVNPAQLYRTLSSSQVTVWVSTPSFARMCLVEDSFTAGMLAGLRLFLFCGETLTSEVAAELLDRFPTAEVWNTYGPTEATVATTSIRVDRELLAHHSVLPVGYPKPDSRVLVMGEDGHPVPDGERGEIVIAGGNVGLGYIGQADLTARSFFEIGGLRAYRTGDWGRYRDGRLFCEGRRDSQLKLHGYRIEPGDVEANLQTLPEVRDCVIVAKIKDGLPDYLAAFVILAEQPTASVFELTRTLRSQLTRRLPVYMVPRKFVFLETFPLTPNGKADRQKLAETLD
jgi:D-alanine--poly(phosphoribitol) ligase subunit 1